MVGNLLPILIKILQSFEEQYKLQSQMEQKPAGYVGRGGAGHAYVASSSATQRKHSDAGSIRSARSGISAMQMDAVRSGAYRVSRIPKEMVTTKEDLTAQLRPKMDLISRA